MKPIVLVIALLHLATWGFAQDAETLRITHRFDWRRSVDQKYQGLVYGYLTGSWKVRALGDGWSEVEARYYQASESRRNNVLTEKPIEAERLGRFRIDPKGQMTGFGGEGVPLYRNFPAPLPADAGPGSVWTGTGELVSDFLGSGIFTRVPILIEYRWVGEGDFGGTKVVQVATQYALRYRSGMDRLGDPDLAKAEGSRKGVVSYEASSHRILFLRENAKEQYSTNQGRIIGNEGIVLSFYEGVPALGTGELAKSMQSAVAGGPRPPVQPDPTAAATATPPPGAPGSPQPGDVVPTPSGPETRTPPTAPGALPGSGQPIPDVRVEADPRGVKLTLDNLKFVADKATLLPGEVDRLAAIVELLKTVPGRNLLVVGHTADVGTAESQVQLSVDRALAIVERLKAAGIPASRLLYEGRGGRDPVAPNTTEADKARNRRVEIVILDQ